MAQKKKYDFSFQLVEPIAKLVMRGAQIRKMTNEEFISEIITGTVARGSPDRQIMLAHDYKLGMRAGTSQLAAAYDE